MISDLSRCSRALKHLKKPKGGSPSKTTKKKVGACSLTHSTSGVGGHARAPNGIRMNSQARVQDEVNLCN